MSLNGLDHAKVAEAYEAAAAEPGGWFLLKYASRDEAELLSNGNGGLNEVRNAVAEYDETSPLYGFLKYRRRNVLIKYLPEGCSRLIQARVAVHFNAICERFSPYDSHFEITTSDELLDSKLSDACSLHAATGSHSSSGSLRRKHLMEIAEEDEDEQQQPAKRQSLVKGEDEDKDDKENNAEKRPVTADPVTLNADLAASPEHAKFSAPTTSEMPNFVGAADDPSTVESSRRISSQSGRDDIFSSYSSYSHKPRVKLGPRPSLDTSNTRPQTAGNFRPVSAIPAGFKLFGKGASGKKSASGRKDSAGSLTTTAGSPQSDVSELSFATTTIPIPEDPSAKTQTESPRPATSSGISTKSATTVSSKHTMTPEKARLKKAMQLREKKKKKKAANNSPPVPAVPPLTTTGEGGQQLSEEADEKTEDGEPNGSTTDEAEKRMTMIKADSGIAIAPSPASTKDSEVTQTDSQPTSPVIASSEAEQSTKASSVSDSTDQTAEATGSKATDGTGNGEEAALSNQSTPKLAEEVPVVTNGAEAEATESQDEIPQPQEIKEDSTIGKRDEPSSDAAANATPATPPTSEQQVGTVDNEKATEEQREAIAEPVSNNADDVPETPKTTPAELPEDGKPETQEIPGTEDEDVTKTTKTTQPSNILNPKLHDDNPGAITSEEDAPAAPLEQTALEESPDIVPNEAAVDEQATNDAETTPALPKKQLSTKRKGPGLVQPIRTDLAQQSRPTSQSEFNFSDDESLLEELQSATVQEAKPMFVSKTPLTPVFPGKLSAMESSSSPPATSPGASQSKPHVVRTASNPVRSNLAAPPSDVSQSSARSVSQGAAYLHQVTQQRNANGDANLAKKNNVGSSISQRIKALEQLSANTAETASQPGSRPGSRPSSTFFSVKKDRVPSRSPSVVDRANSLTRDTRPSTAHQSGEDSPESSRLNRERSGSISSRLSMFEPANSSGNTPRGRPETISVTAKIIRDSPSQSRNPSEQGHLDLKQSPLLVDHQKAMDTPDLTIERASEEGLLERRTSASRDRSKDSDSRRSSFSLVRDFIKDGRKSLTSPSTDTLANPGAKPPSRPPSTHQNSSSFTQRLSMSGRRSLSKDRDNMAGSMLSEGSADDDTKSNSDKKGSRTSRLMRRLSSLSGSSRNKISSHGGTPTVTEEILPDPPSASADQASSPSVAAHMGDVNVQFPDTLLWKRRNMYLDSQGFVVLSSLPQAQQSSQQRTTGVKRYHLGDFRTPYAPDVEVQELPNSVVLDLVEGSAVQVACEDRTGQRKILQVLRDAHAAYAGQ